MKPSAKVSQPKYGSAGCVKPKMMVLMAVAKRLMRKYVSRRPRRLATQPPSRLPKMPPPERCIWVIAVFRAASMEVEDFVAGRGEGEVVDRIVGAVDGDVATDALPACS